MAIEPQSHDRPRPARGVGWPLAFLIVALAVLGLAGWIFFRVETLPFRAADRTGEAMEVMAAQIREAFVDIAGLEPTVVINQRIVHEQSSEILELALVERETSVEREMTHSWAGSTKRLRVRGVYRVKAGFDLTEPFEIDLSEDRIEVSMPEPSILSVENLDMEVLELQSGIWNRVQPSDVEEQINELRQVALLKLEREGILQQAEGIFMTRLEESLAPPVLESLEFKPRR